MNSQIWKTLLMNFKRLPEIPACRKETRQWLSLALAYSGVRPLRFPYELRLRSGEVLILREHMDLVIFWLVFARRHYPVRRSDAIIIDVGANIGFFTLYAVRQAPSAQVIAIEPFPDTFLRLKELIRTNHLEHRVRMLNCALASSAGAAAMDARPSVPSQYRAVSSALTQRLNLEYKGSAPAAADDVPVRTMTLSQLLTDEGLTSADLVKMNIHGNEYEVLLSTPPDVLRRFQRITVQYHSLPTDLRLGKEQLFEYLGRAGFELAFDSDTQRGAGLAVFTVSPLEGAGVSKVPEGLTSTRSR
jgi:FkbM family methyltransferase